MGGWPTTFSACSERHPSESGDNVSTKHWQTIMVVVTNPFGREQLAASKAAAVARRCGARVVLFNAFMIPQPVADVAMGSHDAIIQAAIRQRRAALRAIAARLRLPRNTECVVRWDHPIDEAIVRQVRKTKPDLLVSESHRHGRLARLVLANTDWLLIRDTVKAAGMKAVIPSNRSRKRCIRHDKALYRERNRIERCFNKLKHFRRLATRYDRRARHFLAFLCLAGAVLWMR